MKLSEHIKQCLDLLAAHGDLTVVVNDLRLIFHRSSMTQLKILSSERQEFILNTLAHIVGNGHYAQDLTEPTRWLIDLDKNNWQAHIKDSILTINGRYADALAHQAVKTVLLDRCHGLLSETHEGER